MDHLACLVAEDANPTYMHLKIFFLSLNQIKDPEFFKEKTQTCSLLILLVLCLYNEKVGMFVLEYVCLFQEFVINPPLTWQHCPESSFSGRKSDQSFVSTRTQGAQQDKSEKDVEKTPESRILSLFLLIYTCYALKPVYLN